jgi:hypothetical protein
MSPYEFAMTNYEKSAMRGGSAIKDFESRYGAFEDLEHYKEMSGTDWQTEMFNNKQLSHSHNISVTGGTDKTKFTLSGTYATDKSLM